MKRLVSSTLATWKEMKHTFDKLLFIYLSFVWKSAVILSSFCLWFFEDGWLALTFRLQSVMLSTLSRSHCTASEVQDPTVTARSAREHLTA